MPPASKPAPKPPAPRREPESKPAPKAVPARDGLGAFAKSIRAVG